MNLVRCRQEPPFVTSEPGMVKNSTSFVTSFIEVELKDVEFAKETSNLAKKNRNFVK